MADTAAPPGWHDDPNGARVLRWWDGHEWTDAISPRRYEPLPSQQLEKERTAATRAHLALIGLVLAQLIVALLYVWLVRRFVDEIDAAIDSDGDDPIALGGEGIVIQPFAFAALGLWVVVYLWVYAAATLARSAGLPARREPGLVVASFFIPIVNLWWPYQSICDTLPPDHPTRRRVLRWWLLTLALQFSFVIAIGAAFLPGAAGLLVAMAVVTSIAIPMAATGQALIAEIVAVHDDLLVERRLTATVAAP